MSVYTGGSGKNEAKYKSVVIDHIDEPLLQFGFQQKLEYPRHGLFLFGPDRGHTEINEIRFGVIGTKDGIRRLGDWMKSISGFIDIPCESPYSSPHTSQHVPFPGFMHAFDASLRNIEIVPKIEIDTPELKRALHKENRHEAIKEAVELFILPLIAEQNRLENAPDIWFVVIPEEVYKLGRPLSTIRKADRIKGEVSVSRSRAKYLQDNPTLFGEEDREAEVYLYATHFRRQLKARLLNDRIVTQIVRETTLTPQEFVSEKGNPLRRLEDPASVAWKMCTGVYYKSGGKPWSLADIRSGVCYVGLVYKRSALLRDERHACCAAQMFLADGDGIVFRGALGPWYSPDTKQFHLDKEAAYSLIEMVLSEYMNIYDEYPNELFLHAQSSFTNDEWDGFQNATKTGTKIVGVQIRGDGSNFKLFRQSEYPVIRGTVAILNDRDAYLWTTGFVPCLGTYIGPETPNPIFVRVRNADYPIEQVLQDIMGLTKINFNSCQFNCRFPVTLNFANAIGDVLVAAPSDIEPRLPFKYYV